MSDRGNPTLPAQWGILRTEPIEPQDVIRPEDNGGTNAAETLSNRPNQTLISTQTITHEYLTLSGKVTRETVKKNGSVTDVLDFVYDESGRPFALIHQTDGVGITLCTYYYVLNLQGDVVKLVTASGDVVANYEYDAWGNILLQSGEMASINPLRYRGYYYDTETGFYYLQSRYYDSVNHRFINADSYASTGQGFVGVNMFAYCNNNPAVYADPHGYSIRPSTVAINDGGSTPSITTKTEIVAYINYNAADGPEIVAASPGAASSHSTGGIPPVGLNVPSAIGDPLYMIGTYRELRLITVGTGYEVHHLIEKRFLSILQDRGAPFKSHRDMPSVVLTKGEHRGYTNAWRSRFPYGGSSPSYDDLKQFFTTEYAGKSEWLDLLSYYLN